jgi:hypothetical protein
MTVQTKVRKIPKHKIDYDRLGTAIVRDHFNLMFVRQERARAVKQFVGLHYSENGAEYEVYVNLLAAYVEIMGRSLVSQTPRFLLSTFEDGAKPIASAMMEWVNDQLKPMGFQESLHRCAVDSLFPGAGGIMKVGIATPADADARGLSIKAGQVFAKPVDFNDWVFDGHCTRFDEASYMGHRFRVPLDSIKDSPLYNKNRKDLERDDDQIYNRGGDEQIDTISKTVLGKSYEGYRDYVTLWEIYDPGRKRIITFADQFLESGEPLRDVEWIGPPEGPYHFLHYHPVPGNAMPKCPLHDLIGLAESYNGLFRKQTNKAERQKQTHAVKPGSTEDYLRLKDTPDGEGWKCDNPDAIKAVDTGGPNPLLDAHLKGVKELYNWKSGNLDIGAGLAPQSRTATQDKMLNANSSRQTTDMQNSMTEFTSNVGKSMCWWYYHDPNQVMKTKFDLPGLPEMPMPRKITPQQRQQQSFEDLKIECDPYSMQYMTPQEKDQQLTSVMTEILGPMMGLLQQQGITPDMNAFLSKKAAYTNMPDLPEIIDINAPPQTDSGGSQPPGATGGADAVGAGMPQKTSRTYNRVSTSAQTPGGQARGAMDAAVGQMKAQGGQSNAR